MRFGGSPVISYWLAKPRLLTFFLCLLHLLSEQDHSDLRDLRPFLVIKEVRPSKVHRVNMISNVHRAVSVQKLLEFC